MVLTKFAVWKRNVFFIVSLLFLPAVSLYSNELKIKFQHLTIKDGLSQNAVYCTYQDRKGFLWFGTEDGLNRYDGYRFKIYKTDPDNPGSISHNYIRTIFEDSRGVLWIGTDGGGVNRYDRDKDTFIHYKHDSVDSSSLSNDRVLHMYEDSEGSLWVSTLRGLNRIEPDSDVFTTFYHDDDDPFSLSHNVVNFVYEDKNRVLWIGTGDGLNRYDKKTNRFFAVPEIFEENGNNSELPVTSIAEDKPGYLWIATGSGSLLLYDSVNRKVINITNKLVGLPDDYDNIFRIYKDSQGVFWVGSINSGLFRYMYEKDLFVHYKNNQFDGNSLSDNVISSIFEDSFGILWFGTTNGGVNKFDRRGHQFSTYKHIPNENDCISDNCIFSMARDSEGNLWIGTKNGLNKIDKKSGIYSHYFNIPGRPDSLSNDIVLAIFEDHTKQLWVGTVKGLNRYDRENDSFIRYTHDPDDPGSISHSKIKAMYEDSKKRLWIGTYNGLSLYDRSTGTFTRYMADKSLNSLSNNSLYALCEDSEGNLWIGTYNGLNRLDVENHQFTTFKNDPVDPASLSHNSIFSIYEDSRGNLWIGTWGGGLNQFLKKENKFINYREKDGLANNVVYGILEDDQGNLWLSTNNGISRFNIEEKTFKNFNMNDGLPSNEFNLGAYHRDISTSELYFGGVNGAVSFYPDQLLPDSQAPNVVLTDFKIFNKTILPTDSSGFLTKTITETAEIVLSYKENVFSFEFAALHYSAPEKNTYAYMMQGFDKEWVYSKDRRFITYSNLQPGSYVFKVKGANKDGVWNDDGVSLKLHITPSPWKTWYAYLGYLALAVAILMFYINRRTKGQRLVYEQKLKMIENEKLKELNEQRTNFFINFAHETKTPLTLMNSYFSSYIQNHPLTDELKIIGRNIDKLITYVTNFMDMEKLERSQFVYTDIKLINLSEAVRVKVDMFKEPAQKKGIALEYFAPDNLVSQIDPEALDRILFNLIDNSIKYTNPTGTITLLLASDDKWIELSVKDTGIGIPAGQLENIYNPYYQISRKKGNSQGIGMGLSIVKKIVDDVGGEITVQSEPGKGTLFTIRLLQYHPSKEEEILTTHEAAGPGTYSADASLIPCEYDAHKNTILLVEDNHDMLAFLQHSLQIDYNIFFAFNGSQALEKLHEIPRPDVIISDIMMDEMDGSRLIVEVSKKLEFKDIPFIFLTAKSGMADKIEGLSQGAVDYIHKPFVFEELKARIESIIRIDNLKKALYEKERFASVGMLIGGISHEIFNPLSSIKAPLQILENMIAGSDDLKDNKDVREILKDVHSNITKIEDIIKNLRALYSNKELKTETIDFPKMLESIIIGLQSKIGTNIRLEYEVAEDFEVKGNENALMQIVINILSNSIDAIADKGEIWIKAGTRNRKSFIEITDTGKGIAESEIDKIFEAFYTDKPVGKGMGIGLYIVKDLLLKMGWNIIVDSEINKGTRVILEVGE